MEEYNHHYLGNSTIHERYEHNVIPGGGVVIFDLDVLGCLQ